MSASAVQICNVGLMKFGDIPVTSLTNPQTKQDRFCSVFYPILREQLIESFPWNFAMTRGDISAQVATAPAFEFDYAYTLPAGCLRVVEFYGYSGNWIVENGQLLTDADEEIYIKYLQDVEETGNFPPSFVNCLSLLIGADGAVKIARDSAMRRELLQEFWNVALPRAYQLGAIEGEPNLKDPEKPLDEIEYSWADEGR